MITVLFFANQQELIGKDQLEWHESNISIGELKGKLMQEYPDLSLYNTMTAINEEYADEEKIVKEKDIVAFIPPVSGG